MTNGYASDNLNLAKPNDYGSSVDCGGYNTASAQYTVISGAWGAAVVKLQGTINGLVWEDITGSQSSSNTITNTIDVTKYKHIRAFVHTHDGSAGTVTATIITKLI